MIFQVIKSSSGFQQQRLRDFFRHIVVELLLDRNMEIEDILNSERVIKISVIKVPNF